MPFIFNALAVVLAAMLIHIFPSSDKWIFGILGGVSYYLGTWSVNRKLAASRNPKTNIPSV